MRRVLAFGSICCAIFLAGCSIVDTGEIDYRKAELPADPSKRAAAYTSGSCAIQAIGEFGDPRSKKFVNGNEKPCLPLLEGRLFRKNLSTGSRIVQNDIYSIRLEHGLIAFMTEPGFDLTRLAYAPKRVHRQIGEIVVLANVFEFGDTASASGFRSIDDLGSAKVVYYSPDVEAGQDMNFSNIPLKEPSAYNGNPVGIQIVVLELDRMSAQMQSLLRSLAAFGQQSNLAPSGAVGSMLLKLGTSMLTSDNDDTIFEYRFVLDPSDGTVNAKAAAFEEGRYVVKRTNDRRKDQIWRNLFVDHNDGRLLRMAEVSDLNGKKGLTMVGPTPYTEDTYFTLNIIKHPQGSTASTFGMKTLDQLGEEIKTASQRRDAVFTDVQADLTRKIVELRKSNRAEELGKAWTAAAEKYRKYGRTYLADTSTCAVKSDYQHRLQLAEFEARTAAIQFVQAYKSAVEETDADGKPVFVDADKRKVLAMLAPYFLPVVDRSLAVDDLTDPERFEGSFAGDDVTSLASKMVLNAQQQWNARDCDDLVAQQLATGQAQ